MVYRDPWNQEMFLFARDFVVRHKRYDLTSVSGKNCIDFVTAFFTFLQLDEEPGIPWLDGVYKCSGLHGMDFVDTLSWNASLTSGVFGNHNHNDIIFTFNILDF